MKIILIRHEQTPGNRQGRYIGVTDEDLAPRETPLETARYPKAERIYVSPLKRCRQTAELIYPGQEFLVTEGFRECNFGRFENKNYQELASEPSYQEWVDSNGTMAFPEGEEPLEFCKRCQEAFLNCIKECMEASVQSVAMVIHGGTIMSIMQAYDSRQLAFFDYQIKNGDGFLLNLDETSWRDQEKPVFTCEKRIME